MLTALDGIPLGSTEIAITLIETGEQAVAMTGSDGHFAFIDIPAGDYHVVASHPGYAARDHMAPRSMLLGLPL
ncbi:MAG: carboxypeptidase-like regulatory domain-containing protein, partial [Vicinamibacterales bacterium]|nr:carboxypeptidase-like regulatory domain-containing protein [Vicinamibacterales bacterium]